MIGVDTGCGLCSSEKVGAYVIVMNNQGGCLSDLVLMPCTGAYAELLKGGYIVVM